MLILTSAFLTKKHFVANISAEVKISKKHKISTQ